MRIVILSFREFSSEQCMEIPQVAEIVHRRRLRLTTFANELLFRIFDNVQTIPYGMRWISKKIRDLAIRFFPEVQFCFPIFFSQNLFRQTKEKSVH